MNQRPLTSSTREFLSVSDEKERGIRLHDRYESRLVLFGVLTAISTAVFYFIYGYLSILVFGGVLIFTGVVFDISLKWVYGFSEKEVVLYYALEFYDEPTEDNLNKLQSWNTRLFDFRGRYYYPMIGLLIEESKDKDNSVDFVRSNIPDTLRLVEQQYSESYREIVSINKDNLPESYNSLIQEVNYSYKFGAYTSTAVLIRKIMEISIEEILTAKGLYSRLDEETLSNKITLFLNSVVTEEYGETYADELRDDLQRIRDIGNRSAHSSKSVSREDIEKLTDSASGSLEILLTMREETVSD
jgi:hypothetical protein